MIARSQHRRESAATITIAQAVTRMITWGMDTERRQELLMECDSDWVEMYNDQGCLRVLLRTAKGIPAALFGRMEDHEYTSLPAAAVVSMIGVIALIAGILDRTYPTDLRFFIVVFAIGFGLTGIVLMRSPRTVALVRLRWPALITSVGLAGMALTMPTEAEWKYDSPVVDTMIGDALMVSGFLTASAGGLLLFVATFAPALTRLPLFAGGAISVGAALFGTGFIVWGVVAVTTDLSITVTAVGAGLGTYSLVHVLPRLRHLDRLR